LPRLDDKLGQLLRGPTEWSNWVIPGHLMMGQYPGAFDDKKCDQLLKKVLSKGVDTFICLQEEIDNDIPEEVWRSGVGLRPYFRDAQRLSNKQLKYVQVPITDGCVASDDVTAEVVTGIVADILDGRIPYIHCWGGHGRTGTFVCLILSYVYRISATEALKRCQVYHDCRIEPGGAKSPQTVVQRDQVKRLVTEMLKSEAPGIEIRPDLPSMEVDTHKRGAMRPMKKTSQTASCPALRTAADDGDNTPTSRQPAPKLKTVVHERAFPDHLALPAMPGASANTRREALMRQKAAIAAQRRRKFDRPCSAGSAGDPLEAIDLSMPEFRYHGFIAGVAVG